MVEIKFMNDKAIPVLDSVKDDKTLGDLAGTFWNLCLWENDRAKTLDSKAISLLGLSSIAAAVVAVGGIGQVGGLPGLLWARCVSLVLFAVTVAASLYSTLGRHYGTFSDEDVIASLRAHEQPVGEIRPFEDKDPRRCFLKETILQRWLVYRWHEDVNDARFKWLRFAQIMAVVSVLSLVGYVVLALYHA